MHLKNFFIIIIGYTLISINWKFSIFNIKQIKSRRKMGLFTFLFFYFLSWFPFCHIVVFVSFILERSPWALCMCWVQGLWAEGARKIGVAGLPPMGCLPIVITLNSENAILQRSCIEYYSSVARKYNQMLQNQLHFLHNTLSVSGAPIYYIDVYGPLMDMIQGNTKFGE